MAVLDPVEPGGDNSNNNNNNNNNNTTPETEVKYSKKIIAASAKTVVFSNLIDFVKVKEKESFTEINPGGIQVTSNSDSYVKIKNEAGKASNKELMTVKGGNVKFDDVIFILNNLPSNPSDVPIGGLYKDSNNNIKIR